MPGGRERLTDTKTQTLRLAPLGSYFDLRCVCSTGFPTKVAKIK